jgi:hypothetical protein
VFLLAVLLLASPLSTGPVVTGAMGDYAQSSPTILSPSDIDWP